MKTIALLGQPNSGKSTIFNALTGNHQHVGNWPGKTVEKCEGTCRIGNSEVRIADLPGSYSLMAESEEEVITRDYITEGNADLVLILADASQLERSLYMLADYTHLNCPAVLVLNMMDVAEAAGKHVDTKKLEEKLGIPVVPFVAAERKMYPEFRKTLKSALENPKVISVSAPEKGREYAWIDEILEGTVTGESPSGTLSKFDRIATGRISGKILALVIVLAAFLVAMLFMLPFMGLGLMCTQVLEPLLGKLMNTLHVYPFIGNIISVLIPNTLYFALSMSGFVFGVNLAFSTLEDVGYIARVAYVFDEIMTKLGVQGKSICSMLMGFGCTIGAATGSRVIDNYGQRVLTIALSWAVPCSAILSTMPVLATIFFGPASAIVIVLILAVMVLMIMLISKVFGAKLSPADKRGGLVMELPPYHRPHIRNVFIISWNRSMDILKRALVTIFLISIVFYLFSFSPSGKVENSLLYIIGTAIEPVTKFFGMGWQTFMAWLSSAFAKEATLGVLNAVYAGKGSLFTATFMAKAGESGGSGALYQILPTVISQAEALAFIMGVSFNVPCVMALSTTFRETHSFKWTVRLALFFMGSALVISCITYHIAVLAGLG